MPADYAFVRAAARTLVGTEESTSYGTPALKVRGKLIARLREDGTTLVLRTSIVNRDFLMQLAPETFYITDHYRDHPWVLVSLARVKRTQLSELLEDAWRSVAPKALVATRDGTAPTKPKR